MKPRPSITKTGRRAYYGWISVPILAIIIDEIEWFGRYRSSTLRSTRSLSDRQLDMREILLPALFPLREEPHSNSKLSFLRLESCPSKLFLDFDQKGSLLSPLSCPKNSLLDWGLQTWFHCPGRTTFFNQLQKDNKRAQERLNRGIFIVRRGFPAIQRAQLRSKKKANKSATEKLFWFERAKRFEGLRFKTMLWEDYTLPKRKD